MDYGLTKENNLLTITEKILFTIKNNNKMLIDVSTLVRKPIEHKAHYI